MKTHPILKDKKNNYFCLICFASNKKNGKLLKINQFIHLTSQEIERITNITKEMALLVSCLINKS